LIELLFFSFLPIGLVHLFSLQEGTQLWARVPACKHKWSIFLHFFPFRVSERERPGSSPSPVRPLSFNAGGGVSPLVIVAPSSSKCRRIFNRRFFFSSRSHLLIWLPVLQFALRTMLFHLFVFSNKDCSILALGDAFGAFFLMVLKVPRFFFRS